MLKSTILELHNKKIFMINKILCFAKFVMFANNLLHRVLNSSISCLICLNIVQETRSNR